ncbi:MAG: hypothetical protein QOF58_2981 [Pseudonocardiales bacterium]|jgi:hypothetical protein|nr:hypothetical protein [Pseudonocardiales bacterium]
MSEYRAEVLADSAYEHPVTGELLRVTTMLATFPRFILAEWNTHRMLSRNSNSSRAIPPERQIAAVRESPFVPATFNRRVKGMGVGEELPDRDAERARRAWLRAATTACIEAEYLLDMDVDKSRINRLLEPFLWHTAIFTATDWDNVWALRDAPTAQPEFQTIASLMRETMGASSPVLLAPGQWHLPGLTHNEWAETRRPETTQIEEYKQVSAGRLAKWTSYGREYEYEGALFAQTRCGALISSFHLSPLEHQCRPFTDDEWALVYSMQRQLATARAIWAQPPQWMLRQLEYAGNLRGFVQFRKEIANEHDASRSDLLV